MTFWEAAALALLVGGLLPALLVAARGDELRRLLGLQMATPVAVMTLLVIAQLSASTSYVVVPLTLAVLSYAGTLVFVRLVRSHR